MVNADDGWPLIFGAAVASSTLSAIFCLVMLLDFKYRSTRATEYPASFICWVAFCDIINGVMLASIFIQLCDFRHDYAHYDAFTLFGLHFQVLRFSMFASQLWTAAWCMEMIRKVRSAFSRPHPQFYHAVIWSAATLNVFVGIASVPEAWECRFDGDELMLSLGTYLMKVVFVVVAFINLLTAGFVIYRMRQMRRQENIQPYALFLYLLYPLLFLALNVARVRITWFDSVPLQGGFDTLCYMIVFCSEGSIVSITRLVEAWCSSAASGPHHIEASFLHCGLNVLNQCSEDDAESLGRSLERYLYCECRAEEAISTAALEMFAEDACDEEKDFGKLIEPWKFRLLRRTWGLQSFFLDHRESLGYKFTQSFKLRRTAGASAAFFVKCEEEGVIIKVEPGSSIAGQVKTLMPGFCSHLRDERGSSSLLCRLYGCLVMSTPGGAPLSVLLMEYVDANSANSRGNLNSPNSLSSLVNLDVKGRSDGQDECRLREIMRENPGAGLGLLRPGHFEALSADLDFLAREGRTDYSLFLLGSAVRIIDFLQEFDVSKRSEWTVKRLRTWREPAVQPPHIYARRMLSFVRSLQEHQRIKKSFECGRLSPSDADAGSGGVQLLGTRAIAAAQIDGSS